MNEEYNRNNLFPRYIMYGHAYVPNQMLTKIFSPETGLRCGTAFPELVSPYMQGQSMKVIETLKGGNRYGN